MATAKRKRVVEETVDGVTAINPVWLKNMNPEQLAEWLKNRL